jgi:N-acetylglucosamine-6-phosphate deacetylase
MSEPRLAATDRIAVRGGVVLEDTVLRDGVVLVDGDRISWVGPADECPAELLPASTTAPWVAPGLVDVHNHGGGGFGFPEADAAGCRSAARHHLAQGTTTMLASLVSAPVEVLEERVGLLAGLVEAGELAGVHLEGPFLSASRCGAHDPRALIAGSEQLVERLVAAGRGSIRSMTIAPEVAGWCGVVLALRRHDVMPSIGHTDATSEVTSEVIRAAGPGPLSATHLFNAMSPLDHRSPGAVTACLAAAARGDMVVELIADGVHLHDETVSATFDLVGADRIALVSDAMAAAGMADGRYSLGSMDVEVGDGVARIATTSGPPGAIAGGTASLIDVVRRTVRAGVPLVSAVKAATAVPARLLGLEHELGRLVPGLRADLVTLDESLQPVGVMRAGRRVEGAEGETSWK